ncbi:MAG: hypothetical protein ACOC6J_05875 [Spirochaetota bacterium]
MKYSKLMKERVRRVSVLLRELGFEMLDGEFLEETYSAAFESSDGFQGAVYIDRDSKFLELAYTFSFSSNLADFVQSKLEDIMQICYEYGCYNTLMTTHREITLTVFSKIYYAGLNYYALKETVRDYRDAVDSLAELLELKSELGKGAAGGNA